MIKGDVAHHVGDELNKKTGADAAALKQKADQRKSINALVNPPSDSHAPTPPAASGGAAPHH